jgi:hypothetical protein
LLEGPETVETAAVRLPAPSLVSPPSSRASPAPSRFWRSAVKTPPAIVDVECVAEHVS